MNTKQDSERKLREKIARCDAIMERTKPIWERPNQIPGAFETGRSNRPRSLDRALDTENNRKSKAFSKYEQARKDKLFYESRLDGLTAGTHHANGQPRANSPTRQEKKTALLEYSDWIRDFIKQGGKVCLSFTGNHLPVVRANAKSVTDYKNERWGYNEILPMDGNDKPMETKEAMRLYKAWKAQHAETE